MATQQMSQPTAESMVERAVAFGAAKMFGGDNEQARRALRQGRCDVCDYVCYSLARQVGEYLGQMDANVKAIYLIEPEYATDGESGILTRTSGINLIAWVDRKSPALDSLAASRAEALAEGQRRFGCVRATACCYTLNLQAVDDADVRQRRGYGALIDSPYARPIPLWMRTN